MIISGWGQFPKYNASVIPLEAASQLNSNPELFHTPTIARGMGRSYGDAALSDQCLDTTSFDYFIDFCPDTGLLTCTSGTTLKQIIDEFLPRGWFLPIVPGTQFVSIGGAIANDVHGKNHHHSGCFSETINSIELFTLKKGMQTCSRTHNASLFHATCGGLGLTGIIVSASIKLTPIKGDLISEQCYKTQNLEETLDLFDTHHDSTYSVAWIDGMARGKKMGRSLISIGEHFHSTSHTPPPKKKFTVPFNLPSFSLNKISIELFNFLYYHKQIKERLQKTTKLRKFFFPLDTINNWNRIYGKRGFMQFQCVLPQKNSYEGLREMLFLISSQKSGSFLAVLKKLGKHNENFLSFPIEGYTLAMDFPATKENIVLVHKLNQITAKHNGRVYLAKDSLLRKELFETMYPRFNEFNKIRNQYSPQIHSQLSIRLGFQK